MHFPLLQDIIILLGFSVIVVFILNRFKIPSILGFLITGIIIGPYGLGLVYAEEEIELLAEIGVILLLFVIGMELSMKQLVSMRKTVFIGGSLQVGLTVLVTSVIYKLFGANWTESVFIGFLFSLSSTAIVLKVLQDRNEIGTAHGRNALGILIFQDIIVVPMMLLTPIMAGETTDLVASLGSLLLKTSLVLVITYLSGRYLVPKLLYQIALTNSKELFLLTTIAICFVVAFFTAEAGLSLPLGAFLAGLIISESEYSHQATSTILPFRELFTSFFFISIGMLLDLRFFFEHMGMVLLLVLLVFIVKGSLVALSARLLRYSPRTVILTGLSLFQVGEFAFILSQVGIEYGLLTREMNQYFLSVSIITMLLTPFIIIYSERLTLFMERKGLPVTKKDTVKGNDQVEEELEGHLVIIGFGINGRNVAKAAQHAEIPYVVIELNPDTVKKERANGVRILYGDATQLHILETARTNKARATVVAIADSKATKSIVSNIRQISQSVFLIVRTRFIRETEELIALGADEVIPEEFETSIEVFSRVLTHFLVPVDQLEHLVYSIRADNYQMLRPQKKPPRPATPTQLTDFRISCVRILNDSGKVVNSSIRQADIRQNYGVTVLAIRRKDKMIHSITPEEKLYQNDQVFVSGDPEHIEKFYHAVS